MDSKVLDLTDEDYRKALEIGLASLRHYVGEPVEGVQSADSRYLQDHLAEAEYVMGSSPAVADIFKDTDPHLAAQEKKILALVFLAWPAIPDFSTEELAGYIGNVAANIAAEMAGFESSSEPASENTSDLAQKGKLIDSAFIKINIILNKRVEDVPEGLLDGIEREMSAMLNDAAKNSVPQDSYVSFLQDQALTGLKLTQDEKLYILNNTQYPALRN